MLFSYFKSIGGSQHCYLSLPCIYTNFFFCSVCLHSFQWELQKHVMMNDVCQHCCCEDDHDHDHYYDVVLVDCFSSSSTAVVVLCFAAHHCTVDCVLFAVQYHVKKRNDDADKKKRWIETPRRRGNYSNLWNLNFFFWLFL